MNLLLGEYIYFSTSVASSNT